MRAASILPTGVTAGTTSATHLELGMVVVVAVLFIALLVVRAKHDRALKLRKAASEGYYDPDVARYVHSPVPDAPGEAPMDDPERSLAPTFAAPVRSKSSRRGAPVPPAHRAVSTAFGAGDAVAPRPVPAFDQAAAIGARPVPTSAASAPAAPPAPAPAPQLPPPPPAPLPAPPAPRLHTVSSGLPVPSLPPMEQQLPPGLSPNGKGPVLDRSEVPGP